MQNCHEILNVSTMFTSNLLSSTEPAVSVSMGSP